MVIDSDYRGEVMVGVHNDTDDERTISQGDRIAQIVILPYNVCNMEITDELSPTDRGVQGFGSSGK